MQSRPETILTDVASISYKNQGLPKLRLATSPMKMTNRDSPKEKNHIKHIDHLSEIPLLGRGQRNLDYCSIKTCIAMRAASHFSSYMESMAKDISKRIIRSAFLSLGEKKRQKYQTSHCCAQIAIA
jgi:hypothetical protein